MGIEELIERLEGASCLTTNRYYKDGFNGGIRHALELAKEYKSSLPTQQDKVVVPEFIKSIMEQYGSLQEMLTEEYYSELSEEVDNDRVQCWIDDNFDLLYRAWLDMPNIDVVEVPQYVDDFLSVGNKAQKLACLVSCKYSILSCDMAEGELKQWLKEISMNDLLSLYNGYTVEKEQLYYVAMPFVGFLTDSYDNPTTRCKKDAARSTEKEIKSLSLDYWAFAVPVEEDE